MNKPLTVYKASAGSGKTFTLTVDYISILVANPEDYRKILAVTFTNKATMEMKVRIMSQLYGIAKGLKSSDDYFRQVKERTRLGDVVIRKNAQMALTLLTHKYNNFRVQTIDSFFQHILRNLAHELNLTANLKIDLNDEQIEAKAVDELVENLEQGQPILSWIRDYIDESIEDDKGWNVLGKIKEFGKNIFKEFYKEHEKSFNILFKDEDAFNNYTRQLRLRRNQLQKEMNDIAQDIVKDICHNHVDDSSYFTRWLYAYINKRVNGKITNENTPKYVTTCIENPEKWTSSKCPLPEKTTIRELASSKLCKKLQLLESKRLENWKEYQSIVLTLAHLSQLRLLHAISNKVNEINRDSNRFMLSNTQSLIKELIVDSDTPFIFEKIGTRLKHIMIDEFQDTSTIQWSNFKNLLENCIAQVGSQNLIVGDIKQSIYRWRQGDWQLLHNIDKGFHQEIIQIESKRENYRSEEVIVNFNNALFEQLVKVTETELRSDGIEEAEILKKAYEDVEQRVNKKGSNGYVTIDLYPDKKATYRDNVLQQLTDTVKELLEKGYKQNDIAILVRSKNVIQDIADTFIRTFKGKINLVSDEAFRLDASLSVNILIDALHLLTHPDDMLTRGRLVKAYRQKVLKQKVKDSELLVCPTCPTVKGETVGTKQDLKQKSIERQKRKLNNSLPEEYVEKREQLLEKPLLDLVDKLFMLFRLDTLKEQSAYVCTFYDTLADYLREHPADIDDFIKEWEETICSKTIQSDEIEGIRLITIHKSKGLEFPNVLVPFCDWTLELNDIIWCETDDKATPYNKLPLIPIDYSKNAMMGTVFDEDYKHEHFQNTIDNLNLLYVAFTRAGRNLFITGKRMSDKTYKEKAAGGTTKNRSQGIELVLRAGKDDSQDAKIIEKELKGCILDIPKSQDEVIHFEYGELTSPNKDINKEKDDNPFLTSVATQYIQVETFPQTVSFRQSNKSQEFVNEENSTELDRSRYIKVGNILHELFATIYTLDDIPAKLNELEQEGIIYNDEITTNELRETIEKSLRSNQVKDWFSKRWELYNECTILQYDDKNEELIEQRPDRVMTNGEETIVVDFKFGKERKEYKEQVQRYMRLLTKMGSMNVKGYLWYVMSGNIIQVAV